MGDFQVCPIVVQIGGVFVVDIFGVEVSGGSVRGIVIVAVNNWVGAGNVLLADWVTLVKGVGLGGGFAV
jgi:hypothetical protein